MKMNSLHFAFYRERHIWQSCEARRRQGEPAAAPKSSLCGDQQVSAVPLSSLSRLVCSSARPGRLSPPLRCQTTCLNFEEVIHIFSRNINFQELSGEIRAARPGISAELHSHCWSWSSSRLGGLLGGCREGGSATCDQTGLAKRCQRLRWDPAWEKRAQVTQPREDAPCACF